MVNIVSNGGVRSSTFRGSDEFDLDLDVCDV